jgi:hypothetical protein
VLLRALLARPGLVTGLSMFVVTSLLYAAADATGLAPQSLAQRLVSALVMAVGFGWAWSRRFAGLGARRGS